MTMFHIIPHPPQRIIINETPSKNKMIPEVSILMEIFIHVMIMGVVYGRLIVECYLTPCGPVGP